MDILANNSNNIIQKSSLYDQQPFLQKCQQHPAYPIQFICTDTTQQCVFKCIFCIVENSIQSNKLILLNEAIENDQKTVFPNWPIYDDQTISQKIKEISLKQPNQLELKEQIKSYFKELLSKVVIKIEQMQDKMLKKADTIQDLNASIIELYNNLSQKQSIKQEIMNNQTSPEQKNDKLKEIISKVNSNLDQNKQLILTKLNQIKDQQNSINLEQPSLIKDHILTILERIDFVPSRDLDQILQQQNQILNDLEKQSDNVSKIISLVSNKINNCSQKFVKNVQQQLNKCSHILNKADLGNMYESKESIPPNFNNLNENQLKELFNVTKQYIKYNQNQQYNQQKSFNKDFVIQLITKHFNFYCPEFLINLEKVLSGINQYLNSFTYDKVILSDEEIQIFKPTNFCQSKQAKIGINKSYQPYFEFPYDQIGNIIFKQIIDNSKVYIFRFKLNKNFCISDGYLRIGIIPSDKVSKNLINQDNKNGYYSWNDSKHEVVKGVSLNQNGESNQFEELEFRFCLSKQLFYFSDYPNYKNINMINQSIIDIDNKYNFGISFENMGMNLKLENTYFLMEDFQSIEQITKF
ncbi:hypothetical protein TTHERM_000881459 (macronuclear) [Tetrahymena thermophila SB210]|uniref:Zinc carboxypeptidase family protein n=1 Tax=Tetrahymena thermophila (strain SB210) TaxID=312017 RepID=W7XAL4_TETTS|nr:hypothetical protein TTHERM_000881459 [Tetrahymena thermophila SB210]EWS74372.1 hypothetical protein TTHERM_000881459 [Tetrahymena thermophila SB210]|eukprot:XP_012653101.1 hypothetical protein TTHERM_000881459 [Tetrahymena thermophila SB210]